MKFHVLGIGAIGTLVAHNLRSSQLAPPVSLIVKNGAKLRRTLKPSSPGASSSTDEGPSEPPSPTLSVIYQGKRSYSRGYDVEIWKERSTSPPPRGHQPDIGLRSNEPIQSLIVCLKTWDTVRALSSLTRRLSPTSVITLIQNGMGVYDDICKELFPDPTTRPHFILGTTTHGASMAGEAGPGVVSLNSKPGQGSIQFGVVPDPRKEFDLEEWLWQKQISQEPTLAPPSSPNLPLPPIPTHDNTNTDLSNLRDTITGLLEMKFLAPSLRPMVNLHHQLLLKLALNGIINPLTAILGGGALPNICLAGGEVSYQLIRILAIETSNICTAYLSNLSHPHPPPPDILRLFSSESLERRVRELCIATKDNISSMARDVSRGSYTEIDNINGYLVNLGKRLGVPTPNHRLLISMVKWLSEANGLGDRGSWIRDALKQKQAAWNTKASTAASLSTSSSPSKVDQKRVLSEDERRMLEVEEKRLELEERRLRLEEFKQEEEWRAQKKVARKTKDNYVSGLKRLAQKMGLEDLHDYMEWKKKKGQTVEEAVREAVEKSKQEKMEGEAAAISADNEESLDPTLSSKAASS